MSIKHLYEDERPSLLLDFANSKTLDPRITFTRNSTATYVDEFGVIKTAAAGEARFDHNGATGECRGLLIEESRTNTLTHSAEFDNAAWTVADSSVTANALTSPDGTLTADKLVENTANSAHVVFDTTPVIKANPSFSCFVKAAERNFFNLRLINSTLPDRAYATFDLSDGSVTDQGTIGTVFTDVQVRSESVGNSWYRVSISASSASTTVRVSLELSDAAVPTRPAHGAPVYQGDGTSGVYIWGAQHEQGSFPTSYIPTSGSTVQRLADEAEITGTNFSSWYNQDEGTLLQSFVPKGSNVTYAGRLSLNSTNYTGSYINPIGRIVHMYRTPSAENVLLKTGTYVNTEVNLGMSYSTTNFSGCYNGTSAQTSSSVVGTQSTLTQMLIGYGSQHISRIAYYNTRLSDTTLEALTK